MRTMNHPGGLAAGSHRLSSFRVRKMGRDNPHLRQRSALRTFDAVTEPLRRTRSWPGPRGDAWPWAPTYAVVGVSSRFADPYDDDPLVPDDDREPTRTRGAALPWRGPLRLATAAQLPGGGVYVVEDARGQPVYVGQTASFARRMTRLGPRFPGHRVRVARIVSPAPDLLGAVGDAVVRAVRGDPWDPRVLARGHRYGTAPSVQGRPLRVERTVRTIATIARRGVR
jgi:hypothetical protein